jgi:hypothetical protein
MELEIHNCKPYNRHRSEDNIVHLINQRLVEGLSGECRIETKPILREYIKCILVKVITHEVSISSVAFSSMNE